MGTKVSEVMTDSPRCVTPDTSVSDAAVLMESEDVGSLPILEGERLAGVVTDRDIVIRAIAKGKDPRGCRCARSRAGSCHRACGRRSIGCASVDGEPAGATTSVVDENDRLVGVLAQADVAAAAKEKTVGEMVEEISKSPTGPRL